MSRSDEFIAIYNKVADHLSKIINESERVPFYRLIEYAAKKDPVVAKHESRLKAYGDLRNAIVHHKGYPLEILAEPSVSALDHFKQVAKYIFSPPKLIPTFKSSLRVFSPEDKLSDILRHMKDNDFSQVIVKTTDSISLVTTEGIAQWLTPQIDEDLVSILDTTLSDILPHEIPDSFMVMDANKTVDHARAAFPLLLLSPITTLLIRSSVESIFMLSDWVSITVFVALTQKHLQQQKTG